MRQSPQASSDREELLGNIKKQHEYGPMRHRLYEVFEVAGHPLPTPSYEWMYYAGMGDVDLYKASARQVEAIEELLQSGQIVPAFDEDFYMGHKTIRRILHFDDVKFGQDSQDQVVIYDFAPNKDFPDPVIRPDGKYDAAIKLLKERIGYIDSSHSIVLDDQPIHLRGGPDVRPYLTNADSIEMRRRQRDFAL